MTRLVASFVVLLLVAACGDDAVHVPNSSQDGVKGASPKTIDWGWPSAAASKGASRFQLTAVHRVAAYEPGARSSLQVQGLVALDDPNVLLSDLHGALRVKGPSGKELMSGEPRPMIYSAARSVSFLGADDDPIATRLQDLEVAVRLIYVKTWRTRTVTLATLGTPQQVILPPFEFTITPEETSVVVAAYATSETWSANERLGRVLSHRWAAGSLALVDANGRYLEAMGGGGSGGSTACTYRIASAVNSESEVAFPLSVTIRVPEEWKDELVRYRFNDIDLSRVPAPR